MVYNKEKFRIAARDGDVVTIRSILQVYSDKLNDKLTEVSEVESSDDFFFSFIFI